MRAYGSGPSVLTVPNGAGWFDLHPLDLAVIDTDHVHDASWEHAVATWPDHVGHVGFADHVADMRGLYQEAANHSLFWSSQALHIAAGLFTGTGLALPVAAGSSEERGDDARRRMLAVAAGVREALIATWVTTTLLADDLPADAGLALEGPAFLHPVAFEVSFIEA